MSERLYLTSEGAGRAALVVASLAPDAAAARELLLALGLAEPRRRPVRVDPGPALDPKRRRPGPRRRIPVDWLCRPRGSKLHAVRQGRRRAVCGSWLRTSVEWRVPTEHELAGADRCVMCVERRAELVAA